MSTSSTKHSTVKVAHKVSHRTRLKVDRVHRTPENLSRMAKELEKTKGVKGVDVNAQTGSIVIHHKAGDEVSHKLHEILSGLMCECAELAVESLEPELAPVVSIFGKLLPAAEEANPGLADMLVPVSLIAIGFFGGMHFRAILTAAAEFIPFI